MATPEGEASKEVRLKASSLGYRLLRNNSGALLDQDGRLVRFGWGNESKKINAEFKTGDLLGGLPLIITPEMVGKKVAVLSMFEVKTPQKINSVVKRAMNVASSREAAQLNAINFVRELGGISWFASSAADIENIHELYIQELKK